MWASGDKILKGLAKRRAIERDAVKDALWDNEMSKVESYIENP